MFRMTVRPHTVRGMVSDYYPILFHCLKSAARHACKNLDSVAAVLTRLLPAITQWRGVIMLLCS